MGACYSYEQEWTEEFIQENVRKKPRKKKKKKHPSVIYEERSVCDRSSFASILQGDFRESLHEALDMDNSSMLQASLAMGSIVEMSEQEQQALARNLTNMHSDSPAHEQDQPFRLCNFKTRNFLHTHKIKVTKKSVQGCCGNEVSCCPYNSNHNVDYDIWELRPSETTGHCIFHPFTNKYLGCSEDGQVLAVDQPFAWMIESLGKRRNLGFVKIKCKKGYLCMTDEKALIKNHRQITVCNCAHISHLWQLKVCTDL